MSDQGATQTEYTDRMVAFFAGVMETRRAMTDSPEALREWYVRGDIDLEQFEARLGRCLAVAERQ